MDFNNLYTRINDQRNAEQSIDRSQKEARILQLQGLAELAVSREEAQRILAEAALLRATI